MAAKPRTVPRLEPWLEAYQAALIDRSEHLIYLLVSAAEAEALLAGTVPPALQD